MDLEGIMRQLMYISNVAQQYLRCSMAFYLDDKLPVPKMPDLWEKLLHMQGAPTKELKKCAGCSPTISSATKCTMLSHWKHKCGMRFVQKRPKFETVIQNSFLSVELKEKYFELLRGRIARLSTNATKR